MKCPVDGTALVITDRSGVEIDYCPQCRGVWLDRGELDKIIDRNAAATGYDEADDYDRDDRKRGKRRGGLLGELFDFID